MSLIHLNIYLLFCFFIFFLSFINFLKNNQNTIILLLNFEIMLLSINFIFLIYGIHFNSILGQVIVLFVLTIAATEVAIGLAILILLLRIIGHLYIAKLAISKS